MKLTDATTNDGAALARSRRVLVGLVGLFFLLFWSLALGGYLWVVRDFSLFPPTSREVWETLTEPGGALELLSLLLASAFGSAWLGGAILTALALATQLLAFVVWRSREGADSLAFCFSFAPSFITSAIFAGVGIDVFSSNYGAFYLEPALATPLLLAVVSLCRAVKSTLARRVAEALVAALSYPLLGAFSLALGALLLLEESPLGNRGVARSSRAGRVYWVAAILVAAHLPLVWGRVCWASYSASRLYRAALVDESTVTLDPAIASRQISLLAILGAVLILGAFLSRADIFEGRLATPKKSRKVSSDALDKKLARRRRDAALAPIAVVGALGTTLFWLARPALTARTTFALAPALEREDWGEILSIQLRSGRATPETLCFFDLALFKTGSMAERLFELPRVDAARGSSVVDERRVLGETILSAWGADNLAARTATNNFVATRGRSIPATKALVRSALANGDDALAERWASRLGASSGDFLARARDAISSREPLIRDDYIETGISSPTSTIRSALSRRTDLATKESLSDEELALFEARLCFAELDGDFETLGKELETYPRLRGARAAPKSLQETALFLERLGLLSSDRLGVDAATRERFANFTKWLETYQKLRDPGLADAIKAEFADTAWVYYIFRDEGGTGR
ncbi:MAG: hypothetical protein IJM30_12320 [Thermoguttaceae bacterium]|nr:hypothetical protein [Thermoguttaceae bacterium]